MEALTMSMAQRIQPMTTTLVLLLGLSAVNASERTITVNDMLRVEGLGAAESDPEGRWFVYERLRPYEESDDFSFRTYASQKSGHQIWRYSIEKGGEPELLPNLAPGPHSYLQGFSPSGRYLAIMQYRYGDLTLSAYDMKRERSVKFSAAPAFSIVGEHNPVWVSDEELVFSALPAGEQPTMTSVRAHTGNVVSKAWADAWRGRVVTVQEMSAFPKINESEQKPGTLLLANARTGTMNILASGLYADLRLSPNGQTLAALTVSEPRTLNYGVVVDADRRKFKLVTVQLSSGSTKQIAPNFEVMPYSIEWVPDGDSIIAFAWGTGETPQQGRYRIFNVKTGKVIVYEHLGLDLASERERGFLQRPERTALLGGRLAVFARPLPIKDDEPRFTYQDVNPRGLNQPHWYAISPDGVSENLTEGLSGVSGIPAHIGDGHITIWADDGVYRLYKDGDRRRLTPNLPGEFRYIPPGTFATRAGVIRPDFSSQGQAMFAVRGEESSWVVMVDMRDGHEGDTQVVIVPEGDAEPLTGALSAGAVLFRTDHGRRLSRLILAQAQERLKEVAEINVHLKSVDLGEWRTFSYNVTVNREDERISDAIESCLLLPPDYRPGEKLPLIVEVYPGATPIRCKDSRITRISYPDFSSPYLWASRGYAYARITTDSPILRAGNSPIGGITELVETGVDELISKKIIDTERMVLLGSSQGALAVLTVAAGTDRYKGVIARWGFTNMLSHYFGSRGIYGYLNQDHFGEFAKYDSIKGNVYGIGRSPFEDPEAFVSNSPVLMAPSLDVPILLIHTDMDGFAMSQFDEMYGALLRAGKEARYIRYLGEGHGPSSPANIRDMWSRMDEFLGEIGVAAD